MERTTPYLTSGEAAQYLRFKNALTFLQWRLRHGGQPTGFRRGRALLFTQDELDAALAPGKFDQPDDCKRSA